MLGLGSKKSNQRDCQMYLWVSKFVVFDVEKEFRFSHWRHDDFLK